MRRWLSDEDFLDLVGASNAIPGPTSTEVALHVGRRRGGVWGLLSGTAFIAPAAVIMGVLAWFYVRYGRTPAIEEVFAGVKPVVVAIVVQAVAGLARTALKSWRLALLGAAVLGAYLAGITEPLLLLVAAAVAAALAVRPARATPVLVILAGVAPPPRAGARLGALAWVFLKAGALLFGSGYVLLAFLQHDLVSTHHWLSEGELLDAIAIG